MAKIPYSCSDWGDAEGDNTGICRDFFPSGVREEDREAYLDFQRRCREAALQGDDSYYKDGCKRGAHMMLPHGSYGTRYGAPSRDTPPKSGKSYPDRLKAVQTPLRRRTQSDEWELPATRRAAQEAPPSIPAQRAYEALRSGMDESGIIKQFPAALVLLVDRGLILRERAEKFEKKVKDDDKPVRLYPDSDEQGVPKGLYKRLAAALTDFNNRFTRAATGSRTRKPVVSVVPDPRELRLKVDAEENYTLPGMTTRNLRIVALNGDYRPFQILKARAPYVSVPRSESEADRYVAFSFALLLFFFNNLWSAAAKDPKKRVSITVRDGANGKEHTYPSVSLKGLQHSDVIAEYDPDKKSYYTFRNLTPREVAEYLVGLKPSSAKRRKRRGRNLPPLEARSNPVARPSFIDIEAYLDLEPGSYRPIPSNPRYCVYRKIVKGPATRDEEFKVTTCKRARSWQEIKPVNQVSRLMEEAAENTLTSNPRRAHMGRRNHKKFDPLAELMAEFGPTARLGKRQKRGAPNFDRRIKHKKYRGLKQGHYDPYAQSIAPMAARTSLPTNRRNPRSMTPAQAEFAENSRRAAELMRENGMSRKQAWNIVRNNPDDTRYFRQGEYHTTGPFVQDFKSQYEMRRGAYGPSLVSPPVNRRNPSMKKMGGAQLEALANRGDSDAYQELCRREQRRHKRKAGRGRGRNRLWAGETFYKP